LADHAHAPYLQHHFDSYDQQRESASLGMWMFLVTEIMFFGGLFVAYVILRMKFPHAARIGSHELDITLGAFNTAVLIGSSLTMALAVKMAQLGRRKAIVWFLLATVVLGSVFLGVKYVEYTHKFHEHHFPGQFAGYDFSFAGADLAEAGAAAGLTAEEMATVTEGTVRAFFAIYFCMTGLHALHMIIGIGILLWLCFPAWRGVFNADYHNHVEATGLYWHFVDIVWIFLFPLLYLIGRN
jgi:cytochrome c oxidase subunit III